MAIETNDFTPLVRVKGNRMPIVGQLLDNDGQPAEGGIDGHTIVFRMVEITAGTVKVNNQAAVIADAETCDVYYLPTASDMDTAGTYACYFLDQTASPNTRHPYDGARYLLRVIEETDDAVP